jgi:hypothetical protein
MKIFIPARSNRQIYSWINKYTRHLPLSFGNLAFVGHGERNIGQSDGEAMEENVSNAVLIIYYAVFVIGGGMNTARM